MDLNEIGVFVRVAQTGSFSRAAKALEMPKSTVSTKIRSLERRLGVTLLTRTTRKLRLTETGQGYYERCLGALETLQGAESEATRSQGAPRGRLRVTAPVELGQIHLTPLLDRFSQANPGVQLEMLLTDDVIDLVGEGVDLAIRAGGLADSSLKARKLGESVFRLFASPKYLRKVGAPRTIADLEKHRCLHFTLISPQPEWPLRRGTEKRKVAVRSPILSNHLLQLRDLAIEAAGIVLMPSFLAVDELKRERLEEVLPEWHGERSSIHVVHPSVPYTPLKVQLFIRHLVESFHVPGE